MAWHIVLNKCFLIHPLFKKYLLRSCFVPRLGPDTGDTRMSKKESAWAFTIAEFQTNHSMNDTGLVAGRGNSACPDVSCTQKVLNKDLLNPSPGCS